MECHATYPLRTVPGKLGARLALRDADRFVGRTLELGRLQPLLEGDPQANVVLLHGPAGIGKSALMRELARRALPLGWAPLALDGRDIAPAPEALRQALAPAMSSGRPLLLLDSWERLSALDGCLRGELLPSLAAEALVVLASRRPPAAAWFSGGWEQVVLDLRLGPLQAREADALLAAHGVQDPARRQALGDWAGGSPLALALAAEDGVSPGIARRQDGPPGAVERLLPRLLDAQPEGWQASVLAVAALTHVCTPELLAAALPGIDAEHAFDWLAAHPSAEPLRDGLMLHELVGRVLRAQLRRRSPELERELRRRLVDAIYARAVRGGVLYFTRDLQHLVQDQAIRWGFSWDASGRYRIDSLHSEDVEAIAARGGRAGLRWLESAGRYFAQAPERVTVVRDQDDRIAGYGVSMTPASAPAFAWQDPISGPRLEHAQRHVAGGAAVIWRQAIDLTRARSSPVTALIGMAGIIGSGLANPAAAYLPIPSTDPSAEAFSRACGAKPVAELRVEHAGVSVECHVIDYGPGGLLGAQRATVYRELGLAPPPALTVDVVREALRNYGSPALLAQSPLAPAEGSSAARAERVRARIGEAMQAAFGSSSDDRQLHQVLVHAYIEPAPSHEIAATELHLSRTAYFRRLRAAVERVAGELSGS